MKNLSKSKKIVLIVLISVILIIGVLSIYRLTKIRIFDKGKYSELCSNLETDGEKFKSQDDMCNYITEWAKNNKLEYTLDSNNNIIFVQEAASNKSSVSPTVIVVNYNYENAIDNRRVLSSAAMIAATPLKSGKKTVIFVNNANNKGDGYYALDKNLLTDNSKVVYLDYNEKKSYISRSSFSQTDQTLTVAKNYEEPKFDTILKINIGGLKTDCMGSNTGSHANPIDNLSTVLSRLKSKSITYQIADIKVDNRGKMFPTSLEATIVLNSYSADSLKDYMDKRVDAFMDSNKEDNPDCYYKYEFNDNIPSQVMSQASSDSVTTLLYTLKNGKYKYKETDKIPEGYEEGDVYSIASINQIRSDENNIYIDISTQSASKEIEDKLVNDNRSLAEMANAGIVTTSHYDPFYNSNDNLENMLKSTYYKVSDLSGTETSLKSDVDNYFTPMSYLSDINSKMNIVHIRENKSSSAIITNLLLVYVQTKGNFLNL